MRLHRTAIALVTMATLAVSAAPAAAATLFKDDMEGKIEDSWLVNKPDNARIQPWQKSDSDAQKLRGNQAHGGATSYWSGSQPQDFHPVDVVAGESTLTTKQSLLVPADGSTTLSFWSIFQNEGDDSGTLEAAVDTGGKPAWKKVAGVKVEPNSAGGPYVRNYCDPSHPAEGAQEDFEEIKGNLDGYAGKKILLRFILKYGSENRSLTQPCGWYIDDFVVNTTGTPGNAGTAPTTPPAAGPPPATPAKPSVKFGGLAIKGKKATLTVYVSGSSVKNASITLLKGRRKLGTAKAAELAPGTRRITFKFKKKLKRSAYTVRLTGKAPDGSAYKASGKTHDK
jgi:hypothetical protein